jgi:hypothetical protein
VDSKKLAKLHLVGMIPESHLLDDERRIRYDLLVQGVRLGKSLASTKNSIIGYLKREGFFDAFSGSENNFSKKRRKTILYKNSDGNGLPIRNQSGRGNLI